MRAGLVGLVGLGACTLVAPLVAAEGIDLGLPPPNEIRQLIGSMYVCSSGGNVFGPWWAGASPSLYHLGDKLAFANPGGCTCIFGPSSGQWDCYFEAW